MITSSTVQQTWNEDQASHTQKQSACPFHRMMNLPKKLQLNAEIYSAKTSLWNKIQLTKKIVIVSILASVIGISLFHNHVISYLQGVSFFFLWILSIPFCVVLSFQVFQKFHPTISFISKLMEYGLGQYHRAFFETFDSTKDYSYYRSFGLWGRKKLVVRNEKLVAEIFRNPKQFERVSIGKTEYLPFNKNSVLGAGTGEKWLKYRQAFADYFSRDYVQDIPKIKEIAEKAVLKWKAKEEINLLEELFNLIVEIRGEVFFQTSFGCLEEPVKDENFAKLVNEILQAATFVLEGNPGGAVERFHNKVKEAIETSTKPGSLGYICKTKFENGEFTAEEAIQNASMFILAQAPTMVLFWTFLRAAQSGNGHVLGNNAQELIKHLKEELRIHPAVPTIFSRVAQEDFQISDLNIEKGTEVVISPMFIHQNPAQWNNPSQFNADNWEVEKGKAREILNLKTDKNDQKNRPETPSGCPFARLKSTTRYLPFGQGKHQCQGRKYAVEEIFTICQVVFQNVNLRLVSDTNLLDLPVAQQSKMHVYNCPKRDVRVYVS